MRNHSNGNEFCLQVHFNANQTYFYMRGFAKRLTLIQRRKGTRKWPISERIIWSLRPTLQKMVHIHSITLGWIQILTCRKLSSALTLLDFEFFRPSTTLFAANPKLPGCFFLWFACLSSIRPIKRFEETLLHHLAVVPLNVFHVLQANLYGRANLFDTYISVLGGTV